MVCNHFLSTPLPKTESHFPISSLLSIIKLTSSKFKFVVLIISYIHTILNQTKNLSCLDRQKRFFNAGDRNRTGTVLLRQDFKSCASASSATPAYIRIACKYMQAKLNGRRWIRTTEAICSRFTVCPLWPLGNPPIYYIFNYIQLCIFLCKSR